MTVARGTKARFAACAFDPASGELTHPGGGTVRLARQPAELLLLLLARPGEVVERSTIYQHLWPEVAVELDQGLNFCVRQLRSALGDDAAHPRFIETLPRRGYRWLPAVTWSADEATAEPPVATAGRGASSRRSWIAAAVAVVALPLAIAGGRVLWRPAPTDPATHIAVMPFTPPLGFAGAADARLIAEGLLVSLTHELEGRAGVIGPTTTLAYEAAPEGLSRLTREHGVEYLVNARFLDTPEGPRLLVEVIRTRDGVHVWVQRFSDLADWQGIAATISAGVVAEVRSADANGGR